MPTNELDRFIRIWDREAASTVKLLRALPATQYDFRPDAGGRSLGELAWHLAEGDAYMSQGIERGQFNMSDRPPNVERPKTVEALAPGFERVHQEAVARIRKLTDEDLNRVIPFFAGMQLPIREILWDMIILHAVHHRGQLALMCRLAGGKPVGMYGPTREQLPLRREKANA